MILQEPKVDFVAIELNNISTTSSICNTGTTSGGGQYCYNSQTDAESCSNSASVYEWNTELPDGCQADQITLD